MGHRDHRRRLIHLKNCTLESLANLFNQIRTSFYSSLKPDPAVVEVLVQDQLRILLDSYSRRSPHWMLTDALSG